MDDVNTFQIYIDNFKKVYNFAEEEWAIHTPFILKALKVIAETFNGLNNSPGRIKLEEHGAVVFISMVGGMSTYCSNELTALVVSAHDNSIRACVVPDGKYLIISLYSNVAACLRPPTMAAAIKGIRKGKRY